MERHGERLCCEVVALASASVCVVNAWHGGRPTGLHDFPPLYLASTLRLPSPYRPSTKHRVEGARHRIRPVFVFSAVDRHESERGLFTRRS